MARPLLISDNAPEDVRAARSGVVGVLADVSLISYSQDGTAVIMHRLTRRAIREEAARRGRMSPVVAEAIALLADRLRSAEPTYDMLAHTESLLELADEPTLDRDVLAGLLDLGEQTVAAFSKPTVAAYIAQS